MNDNAAPNFVSEKDCIIASYNKKLRLENLTIEATLGKDSKGNNRNLQFEAGVKIGARSSREGGGNGDANITNVNIIGGSNGVLIDGGYAKLDGLRATDGSTGLQINSTAEPTAEKCVEIINCDLSGRYPLRLIGKESGKSISIKRIEDCRMTVLASAAQGNAIEMSYGDNFKDSFNIMVKSIKDCIFASPAVALWASCNSTDQKIAINSIQGCTFVGDNSLTLAGVYTNAFGIKIEKNVEIGELKDCFIVATGLVNTQSIYGNCTATAVYVGSGCKVNMVYEAAAYADGRGNRFGASSENKATWFDIQSGGEVTMNGSGFDESVNLTSDTEMHNGYSCRKLQSGN